VQPANLGKELQFFEKVKNRIRNREAYQELLKCLNIYNQEIINKHELQVLSLNKL
jgi:paired amphipathic helix protein Sin3a